MGGCEGGMREGRERLFVFLVSIRKGMEEEAYLIYRARHTPFVCANNYSPPHTCTWSGAMNLVSPFVEVEAS